MWKTAIAAVMMLACRPPLRPGQTRCTSSRGFFGTVDTNCESGPTVVQQAPSQQAAGWWCTSRPIDSLGVCFRGPGICENYRDANVCHHAPDECEAYRFSACSYFATGAICAASGCFMSPASCVHFEKLDKRDGSACTVVY